MTTEIRHTPVSTAVWREVGDHEEIELICRECDVRFHAEGINIRGLAQIADAWHQRSHKGGTP